MTTTRILVFAKAPLPGRAKTRLIPALGEAGAARLAARLLDHALAQALAAGVGPVELCMSPAPGSAAWAGDFAPGGDRDQLPGRRRPGRAHGPRRAPEHRQRRGRAADRNGLSRPDRRTFAHRRCVLVDNDAVLHRAEDGGYPLLGLRTFDASLFEAIPWSTPAVADITLGRIAALGWRVWLGDTLRDIDEPADLAWLPEALRTP
jgi:glycosyltransferase A (GT-A) superfamily protein (DUF2064 family)